MVNLINSMVDKIKVDVWGDMFVIAEITDGQITGNPGPGDPAPVVGPDIQAGPSGLILTSRIGSGFEHFVRYELWDTWPDPLETWDELWTGELGIASGTIAIAEWASFEPKEFPAFDVGEKGLSWSARVLTKVMSNTEEPDFPDDIYKIQLYRLQLWRKL
ncbi:hypothetical protein ACQP1K_22580 [Sphaerimonospora sp. CA-214678]|uniref:hypothetical protein n=1 Tax=Sphaerimonospora sp. CA-214678 TaxID=3240029 RepID=UPI003D94E56B